ncbi:O-methyltransferase [Erythrobacter sp.]|uniref:O-methyltransferase n=1 Tax=Erythrobacter sp. TaxID=1042 RepID=UPI002EAEA65D|nr:class I SAM-dependent methyltransferase [Erythrobacter sp.]
MTGIVSAFPARSFKERPILLPEFNAYTPLGRIAERLGQDADDTAARRLAEGITPYAESMTSGPSEGLRALEGATRAEDWAARYGTNETIVPLGENMLSGNLEGQFLQMLIALGGAKEVLEIGMFTGFGALAMAEALPEGGRVTALELDPFVADFARGQFDASSHGEKIAIMVGPAGESLASLAEEKCRFDLVFIDADKGGYWDYYDTLLTRDLLAPGGLICIDNTLQGGEAFLDADALGQPISDNGRAIRDFNERLASDPRTVQVLLPIRDGVTLVRRAD